MESKKRMMTGSKMARESRGPFISDGRMASSADRESMKQKLAPKAATMRCPRRGALMTRVL
jgi:hypothetical protein